MAAGRKQGAEGGANLRCGASGLPAARLQLVRRSLVRRAGRERGYACDRRGSAGSVRPVGFVRSSLLAACLLLMLAHPAFAASLEAQRAAMAATLVTQPEAAILSLLKAGIEEGKPVLAIEDARKWLLQNRAQDASTLYHAARAADLSADWKGAAALYQQYLQMADLTTEMADEAGYAVYTLLLARDAGAAYAFARRQGDALLVCPRARQFDRWFLDEAVRRGDVVAVAHRLRAGIEVGLPQDLLIARYDNYFRWLLGAVGGGGGYRRDGGLSQEAVDGIKELVAVMPFFEELKLRLDWAASVRFYVHQRLAGNDVAAPIAEAKTLLEKYPKYALWVQDGWIGGTRDNHPNHVGDYGRYWNHEIEAKFAPIVAAAAKLDLRQRRSLIDSWQPGYYNRQHATQAGLRQIEVIGDYLADPKWAVELPYLSPLSKSWEGHSPEEALELAPKIVQNRHPHTSLLRAIAAGITKKTVTDGEEERIEYGRDYDKMLAALRGPEAWRLTAGHFNGQMTDRLWHYCGRPGGNGKRDAEIEKSKQFGTTREPKLVKPDAPVAQRIAEFRRLWADCKAPQPTIPDVRNSMMTVLKYTPEVVPELLKDTNPEAQELVRDALEAGMTGQDPMWNFLAEGNWHRVSTGGYHPVVPAMAAHRHRGIEAMKQQAPEKCNPHPLESAFRAQLAESLKQNKLVPWLVQAWINMQYPENNAEQVALMQAMFKAPAWKEMPFEVTFSAREWFGRDAMETGQVAWIDAANPAIVCKDLLELPTDADVATTAAALEAAIEGVKQSPVKISIQGLDQLAAVDIAVFSDPKVFERVLYVTDQLRETVRADAFGNRLLALARENGDPVMMHRSANYLWQPGRSNPRGGYGPNAQFVESLLDHSPATALTLARLGLHIFTGLNSYGFSWQAAVAGLKALEGKASMDLGLISIPVSPGHPEHPVYTSQADWLTGNEDSAWRALQENWDALLSAHRKMSVDFLMWALQRTIYSRNDARMEELIKALRAWAQEPGAPWTQEQKLALDIAYGDVAMQLGQLENAHKLFVHIQGNEAYKDLSNRHTATLRRVMVERIAKRFDDALRTLDALDQERVPEMWVASRYARAEVFYDMEEFGDAGEVIGAILTRDPAHAEAKIMEGKILLRREKLMEASELDVGSRAAQTMLVPGENLKVTLIDPTLAVSGAGTEIEVVVWATSGDRETFFLRQFGDELTKFRGEVKTALGAPAPDDGVLQVVGDDEIHYAYSERFRRRMNNLEEKRGGPITVASDALLMASARKLLSPEEQRVADMQARMAELTRGKTADVSSAAAQVAAADAAVASPQTREEREAQEEAAREQLARQLLQARLKPGTPINVRVIDPDASRTAGMDEVAVSVSTSSGDAIGRVVLKETGTHTGWFEGTIPTAPAQASAFAQNTEPGKNPNMVISPRDYPPWRTEAGSGMVNFTIDVNDNVDLGELTINAREPDAKLTKFVLQTGMNPQDLVTVGVFPNDQLTVAKPWHPSVTIMNDTDHHHNRHERSVYDLDDIRAHLERGWLTQQFAAGVSENVAGPSVAMTHSIPAKVQWRRQNHHHNAHVIYRFRGHFYEPETVVRRFRVELGEWTPPNVHGSVAHPADYLLAVNGRMISAKRETPPEPGKPVTLEGEIPLEKGMHTFEIWATGWDCRIGFGRSLKVRANLDPEVVAALPKTPSPVHDLTQELVASETVAEDPSAGEDASGLVDVPDSFFDPQNIPPSELPPRNGKATITPSEDGTQFNVTFGPGARTRLLNLQLIGYEGPAPALNKIELTRADGVVVLPVKHDYAELNRNDTLEILTGDKVTVRYVDDRFVSKEKEKHERMLDVAFSDAGLDFVFFEMRPGKRDNEPYPYYEQLLRFKHGEPLVLRVHDVDMDMTAQPDRVKVVLESRSGGQKTFEAQETGPSTGIFHLTVIPVPGTPATSEEFQVGRGGTITATYRDEENVNPGVPFDRFATVEHAVYREPILRMSHAAVRPLEGGYGMRPLQIGFATAEQIRAQGIRAATSGGDGLLHAMSEPEKVNVSGGLVQPRWSIANAWVDVRDVPADGVQAVHGRRMYFEIEAPHLALRAGSTVKAYVQTEAGREQHGDTAAEAGAAGGPLFDTTVPGTRALEAALVGELPLKDNRAWAPEIPIYVGPEPGHTDTSGRGGGKRLFSCSVPLVAGFLQSGNGLVVRPGDRVHVGFQYTDESGVERWLTGSAKVMTHPVFDVMNESFRETKAAAYVGEHLYLRVVDLGADTSDGSDRVEVLMQAKSGAKRKVELLEVDVHSGVFQARIPLTYAQSDATDPGAAGASAAQGGDGLQADAGTRLHRPGFPVVYDDVVAARYTDANGVHTDTMRVNIMKGADGTISPFSKQYDDPEIALQTQFAQAEAYLEMAKHYRARGQEQASAHGYQQARRLLASVVEQFRDPETRAHAEYLLGNLAQEEADATEAGEQQQERYRAALARFLNVTGTYPDTTHASMAQFKIATVYEKLGEPEIAAQEYVKLAYKYPQSEFLALAMARLGTHFLRKANAYEKQSVPLLEKTDDEEAQVEGTVLKKLAVREYLNSAKIFSRLLRRFPSHAQAGPGGLRAGQAYMRADAMQQALTVFRTVIDTASYDGPDIRAQAMYWAGMCYEQLREPMAAYAMYKRLTFDFPESKWAAYARGQLSQERMIRLDTDLEEKRLREGL